MRGTSFDFLLSPIHAENRHDRRRVWLALAALLLVRLLWLKAYPLNSDEAQHAHVAWAWTRGLLPYRDVFDNHGPLFGLLYAQVLRLLGERSDVLTWLRLAVQPWYLLSLLSVWWMGRRLAGARVALAAMLIAGLLPRFFLVSGQFRTDDMWAATWLAALALVVGAPRQRWRWFAAGLLAGVALSVSQKTVLLLATALVAALGVAIVHPTMRRKRTAICFGIGLLGLMVVPALSLGWLALHHDLATAWYDLVGYNTATVHADTHAGHRADLHGLRRLPLMLGLLVAGVAVTVTWLRRSRDPVAMPVAVLALQGGFFLLLIWFVWPMVTRQDFLPVLPTLVLVICIGVMHQPWYRLNQRDAWMATAGVLAIEMVILLAMAPPWRDQLADKQAQLAQVLRYTDPDDTVMDAKGDAIYRMRPFYPVIESLEMLRLRDGLAPDTIIDSLLARHTMVVIPSRFPRASAQFVQSNYLESGDNVWIAGLPMPAPIEGMRQLRIQVPGDYVLVDDRQTVSARLDGQPSATHWHLSPGEYRFSTSSDAKLYLIWEQAWRRGWHPGSSSTGVWKHA